MPMADAPEFTDAGEPLDPWVTVEDLATALPGVSADQLAEAAQVATYILWALTGRRFTGLRSRTVRVLAPPCSCGGMSRVGLDTSGFLTGLRRMGGCVCQVELRLPDEDAREVLSVDVYGVRLDATAYRLDIGGRLVRLDGLGWALSSAASSSRLLISYLYGQDVPAGGKRAARQFAAALARQDENVTCKLPQRVTQIATEGVTVLLDDLKTLRDGGTGIPSVDVWVHTVNPSGQTRRPRFLSPDDPRFRSAALP